MKLTADRPYADPLRAHSGGRIYIEKINGPFLFSGKATPTEYTAGLELAISRAWLKLHESGTFVKLTQSGADMFA